MTLAVEMPPDSYGRLEATATLIVDVFVGGELRLDGARRTASRRL